MGSRWLWSAEHLGRVSIRLASLALNSKHRRWYELLPRDTIVELVALGLAEQHPEDVIGMLDLEFEYLTFTSTTASATTSTNTEASNEDAELKEQVASAERHRRSSIKFGVEEPQPESLNQSVASLLQPAQADDAFGGDDNQLASFVEVSSKAAFEGDFLDSALGLVLRREELRAVRSLRAVLEGFGQGLDEFGGVSVFLAMAMVQRYLLQLPR